MDQFTFVLPERFAVNHEGKVPLQCKSCGFVIFVFVSACRAAECVPGPIPFRVIPHDSHPRFALNK